MKKENIMPVVVLTVICIVVAALLGVINYITAPRIQENADRKVNESLYAVLPEAKGFENVKLEEYDGVPETVVLAHKDKGGAGYVMVLETSTAYTSGSKMSITVGIGADGKITGVTLNAYSETKDFGKDTYPQSFVGLTGEDIDTSDNEYLVSQVTYSSKAFKAAVNDALDFAVVLGGGEVNPDDNENGDGTGEGSGEVEETLPTSEEQLLALIAEMAEGADVENVTPENTEYVRRIYKDKNGKGYFAYVVVISSNYGTVESEELIHIGTDGKIKNVNKLTWKTSDAIYGYVPPTEEVVNEFYGRLPGNDSESIDGVELVTNATNTSTSVIKSMKEALTLVDELIKKDMPTSEEQLLALIAEMAEGADVENVTPENTEYVRRIYKDKNGKGYFAYVVVISSNYGTVESEELIHIGTDGKIKNVNKLTWKTSDAIYGYVPPTEEVVNEFYGRLPGNDSESIDGVELVTNATNTSTSVIKSMKEALTLVDELIKKDMPTSEEQLLALIAEMAEGADVENVTPENTEYVRRIYKDKNGKGYFAYVVVISSNYGTVESEELIHIGTNGKIKNVNKLTWKTSDAIYGYVPPTEEVVNEFYGRLPGNDSESIDGVELVTNATNTSTSVIKSMKEALTLVDELIKKDMPTSEEQLLALIAEMAEGADVENVTPENTEYVRRIYKDKNGKGYFAYVVVISSNYGTVESEELIHIGTNGKIKNVNKLTWKTSDAIYGYVPPTEEVVNEFYGRLPGNDSESIDGVELVTNATNTSTSVIKSMKEALTLVDELIKKDMPTSEDKVIELILGMLNGADLENVTPKNTEFVRRIYRDKNGNGYFAYVVVISANYGTVESEEIIHISEDGVINSVNKLTWKTSDAIYGYVPPTEEVVNEFYGRLPGNNSASIDEVELVTNATNTSTSVIKSMKEALTLVDELIIEYTEPDYTARIVGVVIIVLALGASVACAVISKKRRTVK